MTNANATEPNKDDIVGRIAKLMAMTMENGCTEAEAAAASMLAQQLMRKHNIEMTEIGGGSAETPFEKVVAHEMVSWRTHYVFAATVLPHVYAVRYMTFQVVSPGSIRKSGKDKVVGVKIVVFGDKANTEAATWTLHFLAKTFERLWRDFAVREGMRGNEAKSSYCHGLSCGIIARLQANRAAEDVADEKGKNALVLVDRKLDEAFEAAMPKPEIVKQRDLDNRAFLGGAIDSSKVSLNRPLDGAAASPVGQIA
jgi:hypothetical protein